MRNQENIYTYCIVVSERNAPVHAVGVFNMLYMYMSWTASSKDNTYIYWIYAIMFMSEYTFFSGIIIIITK